MIRVPFDGLWASQSIPYHRSQIQSAANPANVERSGAKQRNRGNSVQIVAGIDLGGTAINYTLVNGQEQFLIEGLCEHPALARQGPEICLQQIEDGLKIAAEKAAWRSRTWSPPGWTRPVRPMRGRAQRARFHQFRACGLGRV